VNIYDLLSCYTVLYFLLCANVSDECTAFIIRAEVRRVGKWMVYRDRRWIRPQGLASHSHRIGEMVLCPSQYKSALFGHQAGKWEQDKEG
jgi:hypothetical protein